MVMIDRSTLFPWLALATIVGCGPSVRDKPDPDAAERYAEAICAAHERCDCLASGFVSRTECVESSVETFSWVESWPEVKFDAKCFEDLLEHLATGATCGGWLDEEPVPCLVFEGGLSIGEACISEEEKSAGGLARSSCKGAAECRAGRCVLPPRPVVEVGEPCNLSLGVVCGRGELHCSGDGICEEDGALGEACDTPLACELGLYCQGLTQGDGTRGSCSQVVALGGECDPSEFNSCKGSGLEHYCSPSSGRCEGPWPAICQIAAVPADWYWPADWIPLE